MYIYTDVSIPITVSHYIINYSPSRLPDGCHRKVNSVIISCSVGSAKQSVDFSSDTAVVLHFTNTDEEYGPTYR